MSEITAKEAIARAENIRKHISVFGSLPVQVFIVHAIKAPLCKILRRVLDGPIGLVELIRILLELRRIRDRILLKLPEPVKDNTCYPNTHILIDVFGEFFERLQLPSRGKELKAICKSIEIIYEFDPPYRFLINRLIELWLERQDEWVWYDEEKSSRYWKP